MTHTHTSTIVDYTDQLIVFTERLLTPAAGLMQWKSNEGAFDDPLNCTITLLFSSLRSSRVGKTCTMIHSIVFVTWELTFLGSVVCNGPFIEGVSGYTVTNHKNGTSKLDLKCFITLINIPSIFGPH